VLTSALAECFLRKMHKAGYIRYQAGSEVYETSEELVSDNKAAVVVFMADSVCMGMMIVGCRVEAIR
jgi:hypothetical protein